VILIFKAKYFFQISAWFSMTVSILTNALHRLELNAMWCF